MKARKTFAEREMTFRQTGSLRGATDEEETSVMEGKAVAGGSGGGFTEGRRGDTKTMISPEGEWFNITDIVQIT